MAAYSATVSFGLVLKQLLNSNEFPPDCPKSEVEFLYEHVSSLQSSIEKILPAPKENRKNARRLEDEVREAIYGAQDKIESSISKIPSPESKGSKAVSLKDIKKSIHDLAEKAKRLSASIDRKNSPSFVQTSEFEFISRSTKIVGQEKEKKMLEEQLKGHDNNLQVVSISGMPGIGKTTLAKSVYEDDDIKEYFRCRAWVTVTQDSNVTEIFSKLISSMKQDDQPMVSSGSRGSDLSNQIRQDLYSKRYLIIVDDMWDVRVWNKVKQAFPDDNKGSRIVLTTRDAAVAEDAKSENFHHPMKPLDEANSWVLLSHVAFEGNPCPDDDFFKKIGTKITTRCGGLPLSITVVGGLLSVSKGEKLKEYWKSIAEDVKAAVGNDRDASKTYKKILELSYIHLPGWLKGCFLYMGLFPEDSEIFVYRIINLWIAEGFLNPENLPEEEKALEHEALPEKEKALEHDALPEKEKALEHKAKGFLKNLIDRNLITTKKSGSDSQIKACGLHDTLRDLAVQESTNEKFFHSVRKFKQEFEETAKAQRRVSVHKNILMCLDEVYESSKSIKDARSLLYVGPHHHHPLPSNLTFKLLRVFDAFTIFFIEFPREITELIHLRYLSLTYNAKLPSSLSQLRKLQILIVRREPKIVFVGASFLPDEVWKLADLRHLSLMETDLPGLSAAINSTGEETILLANLQSLSNVRAVSCTKESLQNMPNLKKLGMWLEEPREVSFHLDMLEQLDSFKFTVLNPLPDTPVDFQPGLVLPKSLRKLTLSGCGIPWGEMGVILKLPHLEVLKLRELAFDGDEWNLGDNRFEKLKFLLLEYLNLKKWKATHSNFPSLERLSIKHCYELEEMNTEIGYIAGLKIIEVVDCSPKAVKWAEEIKDEQDDSEDLRFRISSSWA